MPRWTESPTTRTALSSHQFKSVSPLSSPLVPRCLSPSLDRSLLLYPTRASPTKLLFETWQPSRSGRGFRFTHRRLRSSFFLDTREIHLSRLFETFFFQQFFQLLSFLAYTGDVRDKIVEPDRRKARRRSSRYRANSLFTLKDANAEKRSVWRAVRASSTPPEMRIDRLIGRSFHGKT